MNSPSPNNYQLGRGKVYFDIFDTNGNLTGELDLGNAPEFNLAPEVEKLEHYSSQTGLKVKDKEIALEIKLTGSIQLDEINLRNLKLAFLAVDSTYTQASASVVDEVVGVVTLDAWYSLLYRDVSTVVVTDDTGAITYVLGDDYNVDATLGRIYIIDGGDILTAVDIKVSYDCADLDLEGIAIAQETKIEGQLRFMGDPGTGIIFELLAWKASLTPDGEFSFISDDWGVLNLAVEVLSDSVGHPNSPLGVMYKHAA